jgi:hypothetical protein
MLRHPLRRWALAAPLVMALALAACGSQGYAPALGKATTTTLSGAQPGSLTLTPFYATHIVVYYLNKLIPYVGAQTPVELRQGSCAGPVIVALTEATTVPAPTGVAIAPDPTSGVDVALVGDQNMYVVVRARAGDPNAAQLACGAPLSSRRQYFSLFTPGQGSNGTQLGLTLFDPLIATRAQTRLNTSAPTSLTWAVYAADGCEGAALAQGQIARGATSGNGVIFQSAPTAGWSVSLTSASATAPAVCQKVSG